MDENHLGLRERKKRQTRRALVDAALRLFGERGYDQTTIADIVAAADVSQRTFFAHFPSKEDVLFAQSDERIALISEAFAALPSDAPPLVALRRVLDYLFDRSGDDLGDPVRGERLRFLMSKPELQARMLQRLLEAERLVADRLQAAYPATLDTSTARSTAGAVLGAIASTAFYGWEHGLSAQQIRADMHRTLDLLETGLDRPTAATKEPRTQ